MQNFNRCMPFQSATLIKTNQSLKKINKDNNLLIEICVCFVGLFVWGFFCPTREFFTHIEMSLYNGEDQGCKF